VAQGVRPWRHDHVTVQQKRAWRRKVWG
jgi:hypothetical protein